MARLDLLTANGHLEEEINKVQASQQYAQPPQFFWNAGRAAAQVRSRCRGRDRRPGAADGGSRQRVRRHRRRRRSRSVADGRGPAGAAPQRSTAGHHWMQSELIGTRSNRDAIGAVVDVRAGGRDPPAPGDADAQLPLPIPADLDDLGWDERRGRNPWRFAGRAGTLQQVTGAAADRVTRLVEPLKRDPAISFSSLNPSGHLA